MFKNDYNRVKWQCRRGMSELDKLLLPFVGSQYFLLSEDEKKTLEQLLSYSDPELYALLIEQLDPADPNLRTMTERIKKYAHTNI